MKKLILFISTSFIGGLIFFASCKKSNEEKENINKNDIPSEVIQYIKSQGYSTNGIIPYKDGYIVEGDIILLKSSFIKNPTVNEQSDSNKVSDKNAQSVVANKIMIAGKIAQYRTTNLVTGFTSTTQRTITVSLNSSFSSLYSDALNAALTRYNNLGLSIFFVRVTSNANITIIADNTLPSGVYGGSDGFPSNGNPNSTIKVNLSYLSTVSPTAGFLTTFFAHEIGHCIGFRHTDYFNRTYSCGYTSNSNEGAGSEGAIHISGTPTAEDAGSWMLACSSPSTDRPFNANDVTALKTLYPPIMFYNSVKNGTFYRNNCGAGYLGTVVTYTVPTGTYTSAISQADADQKAQNDINTNGQNYANAHGSCTIAVANNDFDMESDYTYISGSLSGGGNIGNGVTGSLTFTSDYPLPSGYPIWIAEFRNDNYIPSQTRTFNSGNWSITITPSAEKRIMITWKGSGVPPSGNITINIAYQI